MSWAFLNFYRACIHRAFAGWFGKISGWAGTVALLIASALLFADLPPPFEEIASKAEPAFFVAAFSSVLAVRLFLAPYWLYKEQLDAREQLERARRPTLNITLPDPPILNFVPLAGGTSQTLGGTRQTTISQWQNNVLALHCTNEGETEATACQARLLSAIRMSESEPENLGVVESISLPWNKLDTENSHIVDIPPAEQRRIWVGGVSAAGHFWLFREIKALPIEYQQLLGRPGTYRVLVQIDSRDEAPQQIALEIIAAEGPIVDRRMQRGIFEVRILEKRTPRISQELWQLPR